MKEKISKLINVYRKYGIKIFLKKLKSYIIANYFDKISLETLWHQSKYRYQIKTILQSRRFERIILWRSSFGYQVELYQRPQHIANSLACQKCLVFYEVTTMTDQVKTIKKEKDNLYLINFNNLILNKILMVELAKINKPKYIQLYSTDWKLSVTEIENYLQNGFKFIYEYIDHISAELSGTKVLPKNITAKYEYVMSHPAVYVVVTAELLKRDVIRKRGSTNMVLVSNGVDYQFFKTFDENYKFESEFQAILNNKKPIIMYYGALASWFDYRLIKRIAKLDKYNIVLFGIKYDESFDQNLNSNQNVYFLGARDYKVLKNYARWADVMIIPFLVNKITKATSPVKIFEYMALRKPIVITDLFECRQYKGVFLSKTQKEFIANLEKALKKKKDFQYLKLLDETARVNDWSFKANQIIALLKKGESKE